MTQTECNDFLEAILEIGRKLIQYGSEIRRVEDTLLRICNAYKIEKAEIYATIPLIVVTIKDSSGIIVTHSVRISSLSNNLGGVEILNSLSRKICSTTPPINTLSKIINESIQSINFSYYHSIGNILAASSFSVFFGGSFLDALVAGFIGFIIFIADKFFKIHDSNKLIYTLIMCILSGIIAILCTSLGFGDSIDKIIIGVVMLFIPTLALINGVKDMFYRDIISGLYRIIEGVLIAASIALGFGLSIVLLKGIL